MHSVDRRTVLGLAASAAALGAGGLRYAGAAANDVETVEVTPALIAAAQKEMSLVVRYSSPVDEMKQMADAFQKRFGVTVQMDRKVGVLGTQQFATEERAGQHIMDVNYSGDPAGMTDLAEQGLYQRFTFPDLDRKLDPGAYLPDLGYCPKWSEVVISYNPGAIGHEQARKLLATWDGLLDPSLKGRIGLNEPAGGGVAFATYLMLYRRPEYGRQFLVKLAAQKPRLYPGSAQGREDLAAGAISVFVPNWESIAMLGVVHGDKTAWTYPEIAPAFANTYLCISKRAPHPNAARLFASWFFTPEGAAVMQLAQTRPTLKGIADTRTAVALLQATDWWKPYPESIRWIPDEADWIASSDELIPDMRKALGWHG